MKDIIVKGGLLRDIGKFIYRAIGVRDYRHQELGAKWARESGIPDDVATIIERHHSLRTDDTKYKQLSVDTFEGSPALQNILRIVDIADNLSAGMERDSFDTQHGRFDRNSGLKSVFSCVCLDNNYHDIKPSYWKPAPLNSYPYPVDQQNTVANEHFYRVQWQQFQQEFSKFGCLPDEDTLLLLLQKFTLTMPEHTLVTDTGPADTSLFHHCKSTSAIALCIYKYLMDECNLNINEPLTKEIYNKLDKKFLIVGGDFSGIQDFIYTIGSKYALKSVRGRSFYLELLCESVVSSLIDKLDLCRSCIIYSSGGGFFLLAPNTFIAKKTLKELEDYTNEYLLKTHGLKLNLVLGFLPMTAQDFNAKDANLAEQFSKLKRILGEKKGRKWYSYIENNFEFFKPRQIDNTCSICHIGIDGNTDLCEFCKSMISVGKELSDKQTFYESYTPPTVPYLQVCDRYYSFEHHEKVSCTYLLKDLWQFENINGPVRNFPTGTYYTEKEFVELAKKSCGFDRMGVLRMDVDHLGKIFGRGLGDRATFARINDLSERFNLYFKYYLPHTLEKNNTSCMGIPRDKLLINLVYAGGDDLFLVGTWDSAIDAACIINEDFKRFTGFNPNFTISGGISIVHEKTAFYRMAREAGKEEGLAKDSGRNRLSIFSIPLKWEEINGTSGVTLNHLMHLLVSLGGEFKNNKLIPKAYSRSFIQNLLFLIQSDVVTY